MPVVRESASWLDLSISRPTSSIGISLPFAGIGGPDRALQELGWPHVGRNVIDSRKSCIPILDTLHGKGIAQCRDISLMCPADWDDSEGLMGGPPCIPFSMLGHGGGLGSAIGSLMLGTLEAVKNVSNRKHRPLRFMVLENVRAVMYNRKNGNALTDIKALWAANMPHWTELLVWDLRCESFGLPQQRNRVFLVAFEQDFARAVGMPNQPVAFATPAVLEDFLLLAGDATMGARVLTAQQQLNLRKFKAVFRKVKDPFSNLAIVDVSRRPGQWLQRQAPHRLVPHVDNDQPLLAHHRQGTL